MHGIKVPKENEGVEGIVFLKAVLQKKKKKKRKKKKVRTKKKKEKESANKADLLTAQTRRPENAVLA